MLEVKFENLDKLEFKIQEAYNTLRTNIQFCGSDIKAITLTSCLPNEGKSAISFQLASSFAESEKKVLFIDADIRKSILLGQYKINHEVIGLSQYLSGQNEIEEIFYSTNIPSMDVIFTGPVAPNPSELLGSKMFTELIEAVRDNYDYIIIDSPPLGSVIDSALIARNCDGAILVIEAGSINYKLAQSVKAQLEKSGCRILGAVLNRVDMDDKGYYGKYYGDYYRKELEE